MIIGGLQKFSLLDYPGKISAIVFTQGCDFRCQFCHNPMLVLAREVGKIINTSKTRKEKGQALISEAGLFHFLKKRRGKLDAVVITGGEPTIHKDLLAFIKKIKKLGFLVKLDTNGANPEMLEKLTSPSPSPSKGGGEPLVDYIAMDIKGPENKYKKIAGARVDFKKIKKSVKIIKESKLPYEFRTTLAPGLLEKNDIAKVGEIIEGADKWYLQKFKVDTDLVNKELKKTKPFSRKEMEEMRKIGEKYARECGVR